MATQGFVANGSKFQRGDGGNPEVFTDVPEVFEIVPGAAEAPDIPFTHLLSTGVENKPGLSSFATFTLQMNLIPGNAVQNAMEDEVAAGGAVGRNCRILHPDGVKGRTYVLTIATFAVSGFTVDGRTIATVTFKQAGQPVRFG